MHFSVMFLFFCKKTGFEREGALAEENSPVDCFCRRGHVGALRRSESPMDHQKAEIPFGCFGFFFLIYQYKIFDIFTNVFDINIIYLML